MANTSWCWLSRPWLTFTFHFAMTCLDYESILPGGTLEPERGTRGCADIFSKLAVTKKKAVANHIGRNSAGGSTPHLCGETHGTKKKSACMS